MDIFEDFDISQDDLSQIDQIEINLLNNSFHISSDEEDNFQPVSRKRRRIMVIDSEKSESEESSVPATSGQTTPFTRTWSLPTGNQRRIIPFTENPGLPTYLRLAMRNKSPIDFYSLLVPDDVFEQIVQDTNQFAINTITQRNVSKAARIRNWSPTNVQEMKRFFALIMFMGLVRLPKLSDYWSKDEIIGHHFASTIMSRNRFELLLQMLHFSQLDDSHRSDRLHRIRHLLGTMNNNFAKYYNPGEDLCIDESVVPFRGRIIFRQYNKQKRHKYGIKEFKLCALPGYTYKINIYAGKENDQINTTPANVVMSLCSGLLNKGHTLYTDNWYTSIDLARNLLKNETHLVGTIRKNRKHIPKEVTTAKLKRGEHIARESDDGITVMKWKDKRDVLVLSTKHSDRFLTITKRGKAVLKPKIVIDYNRAKGAVDLSDQMAAYSSPLRKSVKWYKKVGINLLLNTAVVNALILYQMVTGNKIQIVEFRKQVLKGLFMRSEETSNNVTRPKRMRHKLTRKDGTSKNNRRTCQQCYKENTKVMGRLLAKNKTKKVVTFCETCPNKPFLCFDCFHKIH